MEAALICPLIVLAAAVLMGLFLLVLAQVQVSAGLQYASRTMAASCREMEEESATGLQLAKARLLFCEYLDENDCRTDMIQNGTAGISLAKSDFSGTAITLCASYRVELPVSFGQWSTLPVQQCVVGRKWIGAADGEDETEQEYVYITPSGTAYHGSTACPYLDLSIRSVASAQVESLRNISGGRYYPCSCYEEGCSLVYITDYGTQYHSALDCSALKRTVYRVSIEDVGGRHACTKCYGGK